MIMKWSIIWMFFILIQNHQPITFNKLLHLTTTTTTTGGCIVSAGPVQEHYRVINPFIKHWEAAKFDRTVLEAAHDVHTRRRRRSAVEYHQHQHTPNTIRLQFTAHDKDFRLLLREDPHSVFAPDIEIEGTNGPLHYDTSRVYSGVLEDDEHSHVHGVLTKDNLFDGTITTKLEQYYVEPSNKYNPELEASGIHTVVYRLSDVHFDSHPIEANHRSEHCASERLRRRDKRWVPEDLSHEQPPPSIIDFEVPFNDDMSKFRKLNNIQAEIITANHNEPTAVNTHNNRKNILTNNYNPNNSDFILRRYNKNILSNTNNNTGGSNSGGNLSSRPSHKTHVEIITKNGATKKPNIIVNNYNPDFIYATNTNNNNMNDNRQDVRDFMAATSAKSSLNDRKSTCMLYLQADHTFFQKMGSNEASIETITRHVQRANTIYKVTDFDGNGKPDNITFMIKRIKVHNMSALNDSSYRFPGNYGVEKFLELFSEEDYDAFCLAYMFTYRDFEMGTLGLAWTGDLKNAGGVCEKNGHYRGSLKSLNTGIVTLLNYGKHVPPAVSHVTLAHEIGHNFGSPHDPDTCTPGGEDGNFIMFARATSGDKRNNNRFSPCSLKSIQMVLNTKARSTKGCFTEPQQSICGNGVVEMGEQCDCGWEEDCKDKCCFPMSRHPQLNQRPCTLTPSSICSPSQGPCCTTGCRLKSGDKCRDDNGCRDPSHCDGLSAQCPPSVNKPNKTVCNKEFVCFMGECTGSICLAYDLESCQCIPGPNEPKTKACDLCCKKPGEKSDCKSSFEWNKPPFDVPDMYAKPGTPCNNYNGYCDVFQKCRDVDPSGPLATLRKLLLSEESIASFKKWATSNWYILVITCSLILALLILSTKLLGKQSNLKLKTVTIIHSATTETVRLPDDNNGVIVHTAVRSKVPFKKKVRGERSANKSKNKVGVKTEAAKASLTAAAAVAATSAANLENVKNAKKESNKLSAAGIWFDHKHRGLAKKPEIGEPSKSTKPKSSQPSKKDKKNKIKEVIDYSKPTATSNNTFGKVHKWLLESPAAGALTKQQVEHAPAVTKIINKSQSTPEQLAAAANPQQATRRATVVPAPQKVKTKSVGNLNEKVRLQVVYKPPFKFSLKLSKNAKAAGVQTVKTHALATGIGKVQRKPISRVLDRKRATVAAAMTSEQLTSPSGGRAAMLIQSTDPVTNEPQYETILKTNKPAPAAPIYENIKFKESVPPKNRSSDAFRANRSASSTNLTGSQQHLHKAGAKIGSTSNLNEASNSTSNNNLASSSRHSNPLKGGGHKKERSSSISYNHNNNSNNNSSSASHMNNYFSNAPLLLSQSTSNSNLEKVFSNSQQNLLRSSTTNLDKPRKNSLDMFGIHQPPHHSQQHHGSRQGSFTNLTQAHTNYQRQPSSRNNSRRNSFQKQHILRSNSNVPPAASSTHPPSSSKFTNRHQGIVDFKRQTSLNLKAATPVSSSARHRSGDVRPHTATCDTTAPNPFDWPTVGHHKTVCDPLASDMEVMVSDMENILTDDR